MKKNIIIVISGILLLIMLSLFYTYAINVSMEQVDGNADLTYNINLSDPTSTIITVEPGETKYFDIVVTNTNDGAINYGLVYNQVEINTVTVAQTDVSKYKAIDSIEKDETRRISLVIKNEKTSNITYSILPITGYEEGGDLIVPSNHTIIDDVYSYKSGTITGSVHDYVYVPGSGSGGSGDTGGSNNLDTSGANSPDLVDGLIPVMYSNGTWIKADSTNTNETYKWYDYNNKQWANAVLVSSSYRDANNDDTFDVGDEVPEDAILAYYVWIPRYKYKVFNINKVIGTDSYSASTNGIDIVFESGTNTTGTIRCNNYSFAAPSSSANSPNETCSGTNGEYYTHPAFTFGDSEVRGIWVGKFEVSNSTSQIQSKPNVQSLRSTTVSAFSSAIQNMQASGNSYGLTTDKTKIDSHMVKNIEWGAVAYLTNSDYGRCSNNKCSEVAINSNSSYYTGGNDYVSNVAQSTTGNIYGIYDMSGGAYEYVMGNMSSASGSYTYHTSNAGSSFSYSTTTAKYVDTYAYGNDFEGETAYNRARLGDATGEVVLSLGGAGGWYGDYVGFVSASDSWFMRGGRYVDGADAGPFFFYFSTGYDSSFNSARAAFVSLL